MPDSFAVLRAYLEARASFTEDELTLMRGLFKPRTLAAGDVLQRAGDVARFASFVVRGCLRSYIVDPRGKEHIVQFVPEQWWIADAKSLSTGEPTQFFVDAIEDSDVMLLDPPSHERIIAAVPGYREAMRAGLQKHAAAKDQRIVQSLSASAEERYLDFLRTYPSIAQRVPQRMLASYLGVSPETVSRIRKNLSRK